MEQDLKEQIASLKLQIGLLKNEVAKWKRAHYHANKDRARIERQEIERIDESKAVNLFKRILVKQDGGIWHLNTSEVELWEKDGGITTGDILYRVVTDTLY